MNKYKFPLVLCFFFGTIPIVAHFVNVEWVTAPSKALNDTWMPIIYVFAILLGIVNVVQNSWTKIKRREQGGLFSMVFFGFTGAIWDTFGGTNLRPDGSATPFHWMATHMFIPLQSTMFALLSFYVASAAYRAFRARNLSATLLLIAGVFVMLGRVPFGDMIFSWLPGAENTFSGITEWLMDCPNAAAQRAIMIGAALGAASMALKVLLGIERSYMGKEQED